MTTATHRPPQSKSNPETPSAARLPAEVNQARRIVYRCLAAAFFDPLHGAWELLRDPQNQSLVRAACGVLREESPPRPIEPGPGEHSPDDLDPEVLFSKLPDSRDAMIEVYERTFGLLVASACPPYETEYISSKFAFQRSQGLADIAGFYRAFGFESSESCRERPDHIALELEFQACLIDLEQQAATDDERCVAHEAQRKFLAEHLAWWAPAFGRLLKHECPGNVHDEAGRLLCAFLPVERAWLDVDPPRMRAAPSRIEDPEACDGCGWKGE